MEKTDPFNQSGIETAPAKETLLLKDTLLLNDKTDPKDIRISALQLLIESLKAENKSQKQTISYLKKENIFLENSQRMINKKFTKLLKLTGIDEKIFPEGNEKAEIPAENDITSSQMSESHLKPEPSAAIPEPHDNFPEPPDNIPESEQNNPEPEHNILEPANNNPAPAHYNPEPTNNIPELAHYNLEPAHCNLEPIQNNPEPTQNNLAPENNIPAPTQNCLEPTDGLPEPAGRLPKFRQDPGKHLPFEPETVYLAVMNKKASHAKVIVNGTIKNQYSASEKRKAAYILKALEEAYCPEGFDKQKSQLITFNILMAVRKEKFARKHTTIVKICMANLLFYLYQNPKHATKSHDFKRIFNYSKSHTNKILKILKDKQWVEKHRVSHDSWYSLSETGKQFVQNALSSAAD